MRWSYLRKWEGRIHPIQRNRKKERKSTLVKYQEKLRANGGKKPMEKKADGMGWELYKWA
jgi:hypothetical protein